MDALQETPLGPINKAMSDSQKFPVAAHALAYLAHKRAFKPEDAVSSAELAASMPTNPVVVRRVTAMLGRAGLVGSRSGAGGGAWLTRSPDAITLDAVLEAVDGCTKLGVPPKGVDGCPVGAKIPDAIRGAILAADRAAHTRLAAITVSDLLKG
jgi:DNA-binding IscR family transcriptional regulator